MPLNLPDRYAVLGHPVAHSQSPFIHAEFARQTGQALTYGRIECPLDAFQATVQAFMHSGNPAAGLGPARGCNITVPFKFQALPLAKRASARAQLAQAANVLCFDAQAGHGQGMGTSGAQAPAGTQGTLGDRDALGWYADNTDGIGLVRDIEFNAQRPISGQSVLLIGAGGAAAGVLGPLIEARPARVLVANRSADKADALVQRHSAWATLHGVALRASGLQQLPGQFDLVLNGSASSLAGAAVPVSAKVLAPGALAVDMMYGPAAQPFLDWARAHGATGRDGLGMLVEQAAEAFAVWRGVRPDSAAVLSALRDRLSR